MLLTNEENEILASLESGFMSPRFEYFTDPSEISEEEYNGAGWYHRLSANGYMDCTDWTGPFDSELDAARDCINMYGDE